MPENEEIQTNATHRQRFRAWLREYQPRLLARTPERNRDENPRTTMPSHLTRPMMGCRLHDCGATCYTCYGARLRFCGKARDEHEQRTDTLAGQAEDAADARETR